MGSGMEQCLFRHTIDGREAWAGLFQSIGAFAPLIGEIFARHGLATAPVENLTPGTNAVFRVGDAVVKIFAPEESGFSTNEDYFTELAALRHAGAAGVAAPKLFCAGTVEDRYRFRYMVMDFIRGEEAAHALPRLSPAEKRGFARRMREITGGLNVPYAGCDIPSFRLGECLADGRWERFLAGLREGRRALLQAAALPPPVYTHGDLTGENVLVSPQGDATVIDFADSLVAPFFYEWPPLVFSLFGCDPNMMEEYFGAHRDAAFYNRLALAVAIHAFGAPILEQVCETAGVPAEALQSVADMKKLLQACVEGGATRIR